MSEIDGFEERARAAGRGLGALTPSASDPTLPRKRLRRRRVLVVVTACVVGAGAITGIAVARDGGSNLKVRIAAPGSSGSRFEWFTVPSDSMAPTLRVSQRVRVDTAWYRSHPVQRGDIVVFRAPPGAASDLSQLVKRVIGLPGEHLEARELHVFVTAAGKATSIRFDEPYVRPTVDCPAGTQSPVAGHVLHATDVPADHYFVMGDNRCASDDSRAFGPIPQASIIGRVVVGGATTPPTTIEVTPTTAEVTPTTAPRWISPAVETVVNGDVYAVSASATQKLTSGGGYTTAYRLGDVDVRQKRNRVFVVPANGAAPPATLPDVTLLGVGTYKSDEVAIVVDLHPDALHQNRRWIRFYDVRTRKLIGTGMSIDPGTTLDRVSVAGNLFAVSGFRLNGGPFVEFRRFDGSTVALPDVVARNLRIGKVRDAILSPDGQRIAYLLSKQVAIDDVRTGRALERFEDATPGAPALIALDFDGRFAVVSRDGGQPADVYETTQALHRTIAGATGLSTIDRN